MDHQRIAHTFIEPGAEPFMRHMGRPGFVAVHHAAAAELITPAANEVGCIIDGTHGDGSWRVVERIFVRAPAGLAISMQAAP